MRGMIDPETGINAGEAVAERPLREGLPQREHVPAWRVTLYVCFAVLALWGIVSFCIYASHADDRHQQRIQACIDVGGQAKYNQYNEYESCLTPPGVKLP